MERRHTASLKRLKALLPRRESERRGHQLARHCDILTAVETRISMLRMTFSKYMDAGACCFIPGKVIDEILRVLRVLDASSAQPPRTHELLQELRDISSMAMEHFDERIAPTLKLERTALPSYTLPGPSIFGPAIAHLTMPKDTFRKDLNFVQHRTILQKQQINVLKTLVTKLASKVKRQASVIRVQSAKIRDQSVKLKQQETSIAEVKRHVDEWDQKFGELSVKVSRTRDTVTEPPSSSVSSSCDSISPPPPPLYKPNIKPRTAQILPRSLYTPSTSITSALYDIDRKRKVPCHTSTLVPVPSKKSRIQYLYKNKESSSEEVGGVSPLWSWGIAPKVPVFLSSSLESLLKSPITSIKSRKRKLIESPRTHRDID